MKSKSAQFYFILLFCLGSIGFFSPVLIPAAFLTYAYYGLYCLTFFIIIGKYKKSHYNSFSIPVILILVAAILGAINATYSWGQNLFDSFTGVIYFMSYVVFFLLVTYEFEEEKIEKLIVILGIAYAVIFLFSFLTFPKIVFGDINQNDDTRGFQRIRTSGIGFLFLLSFFSLSEYILKRKFSLLILYLLTMICIVMSLTRTYIIFSVLFSVFFVLKKSNVFIKIITVLIAVSAFYLITKTNFYKLMADQTGSQIGDLQEDIRMQSVEYYLNYFSPNFISQIIGNGHPNGKSGYSKFMDYLQLERGLWTSDIGYIGLYTEFGILSILAYLIFIYKTFTTSVSEEYLYCKYFLAFIFIISIIIDSPFNTSFIGSIMLAYYMISLQNKNKLQTNKLQN
jgi:hypothetical protein